VPLSGQLCGLWGEQALLRAVSAGDDYQIAFTAPPGLTGPFTQIGRVEAGSGAVLTVRGQEVPVPSGYRHF
jgi:thiamine monophosphate kinase